MSTKSGTYTRTDRQTDGRTDGQKSKSLKTPKTYSKPLKRVFRQYYFLTFRTDGRTDKAKTICPADFSQAGHKKVNELNN